MPIQHPTEPAIAEALQDSFGFRDEGFCDYLNLRSPDRVPVDDMIDIISSMDTDTHPLVAYNAGWALAELAMRRIRPGKRNDFSSEERQAALDDAEEKWEKAEKGFNKLKPTATSLNEAKSYQTMSFNTGFALSTLPVMELAADWRCGVKIPPADIEMAYEDTKENLLDMGEKALTLYENTEGTFKRKVGAQCEKLFGALCMHNAVTLAYAMPYRRKLLANTGRKCDFIAVDRQAPHIDVPVRMSRPLDSNNMRGTKKFAIYRRNVAPHGTTVEPNLGLYIAQQRGGSISPEEAAILQDIEEQVNQRFEAEILHE